MPDFRQKARAWPRFQKEKRAEKGRKPPFFQIQQGGKSKNPRSWGLFCSNSLSVEQFLCTNSRSAPTFTSFKSYKKREKPCKWKEIALVNFAWAISTPTFFLAIFQKCRGCYSLKISHLNQNRAVFQLLHFCTPLPPGERPPRSVGQFTTVEVPQ